MAIVVMPAESSCSTRNRPTRLVAPSSKTGALREVQTVGLVSRVIAFGEKFKTCFHRSPDPKIEVC